MASAAALLHALPGAGAEAQRPNLQGTWQLNPDLTARLMQDQGEQKRSGGSEGGGRGGGRHRSGGGGGGRPGGDEPRGTGQSGGGSSAEGEGGGKDQERQHSLAALDSLTIIQTAGQVTITDQEGRSRVLKTNGSKARDQGGPGGPTQVRASWDTDGTLVVEVKPDKGAERTEAYVVSNDAKHLYLTVTLSDGPRGAETKIVRAYDPAPPEKPAEKPADKPGETPRPPGAGA